MNDTPAPKPSQNERIAKVIARSGVASRRDAEKMILAGRVAVNGKKIDTPALDVSLKDKVTIDGKPIDAPQETRLWLYYKPLGLVTTEKDEQGRRTVFDEMPEGMPRVLNVGRLDLNSEGLLLLTNDGGLKRRLELPETGWLRKYRVRVNGRPTEATFDPLRRGITIDGEDFQPMEISLDRQQGANAWLTVGIREGKNREIRRAMSEVGLVVNRLIRLSYGPFRLIDMQPGDVVEVKRRMLRDQLGDRLLTGMDTGGDSEERPHRDRPRGDRPRGPRPTGDKPDFKRDRDERPRGDKPAYGKPRGDRDDRPRGDKPAYGKPRGDRDDRPRGDKPAYGKPRGDRDDRPRGDKPTYGKPRGDRDDRPRGDKPTYGKPRGDKPAFGDKPRSGGFKSHGGKPGGPSRSEGFKSHRDDDQRGGKPGGYGGKPGGGKPGGSYSGKPGGKPGGGFAGKSGGGKPGGGYSGRPGGGKPGGGYAGKPGGRPGGNSSRGGSRG
ncbi:pseudouridine synthase [uncultured Thioclava sp.]|uniref:pseudouridine synthase n=1 Tax=uncultured Thioclava sp. TaxID=473858 RepID=UPI0025F596F7|nr:pseudouridine synthase [uncultured Thioclava sp.]